MLFGQEGILIEIIYIIVYYHLLQYKKSLKISGEYDLVPWYLYWQDMCTIVYKEFITQQKL